MRCTLTWVVMVAFVLGCGAVWAATTVPVTGKVTFACPQGNAVKVKNWNGETMMYVNPNCPNKAQLQAQIKALKVGTRVCCRYYVEGGKKYVTKITVLS